MQFERRFRARVMHSLSAEAMQYLVIDRKTVRSSGMIFAVTHASARDPQVAENLSVQRKAAINIVRPDKN